MRQVGVRWDRYE